MGNIYKIIFLEIGDVYNFQSFNVGVPVVSPEGLIILRHHCLVQPMTQNVFIVTQSLASTSTSGSSSISVS